jgi:sugar transferase (PEP-CTERM/EpsH1 system associated)
MNAGAGTFANAVHAPADTRPLVVHVVFRFDTGGLENGIVNLINHMPPGAYRHAIVALTDITDFRFRIERSDVEFIALGKPPGHAIWLYPRLFRLFRALKPAIVHSRNLAALEVLVPAWAAGVPVRIHGEHGRDVGDVDGRHRGYQWLRRVYRPFVSHYLALSCDLASYLAGRVRVPPRRITQVYNGVDVERFRPAETPAAAIPGCPFQAPGHWIVGTVGRMQAVKDQPTLVRAFVQALALAPALASRLRLVMVGEGPLRAEAMRLLEAAGVADLAWLPGERADVPELMRGFACFALPSLAEGVSNTILEAMASGLPVIATNVGGNAELVADGRTGEIVPPADPAAMAAAIVRLAIQPDRAAAMGRAGRAEAQARFSLEAMVSAYQNVYARELRAAQPSAGVR